MKQKQGGIAFPTVLWLLLIITSLGTIFLIFMSQAYLSAAKLRHEQGAYYLAYSGIMYAKAKLDENPALAVAIPDETVGLPTGTFFITAIFDNSNGSQKVTSTGRYGQGGKTLASRTIKATINTNGVILWQNI